MSGQVARPCIELNLENATLEEVRTSMDCTPIKKGFRRLQGMRWLYDFPRSVAA